MQTVNDVVGGEIGLGQLFEALTQLRVITQLSPFGDRANDLSLARISSCPLNRYVHLLRVSRYRHHNGVNDLSNHIFSLSRGGGGRSPDQGQVFRELLNLLFFLGRRIAPLAARLSTVGSPR